jgi:hypothetical protein
MINVIKLNIFHEFTKTHHALNTLKGCTLLCPFTIYYVACRDDYIPMIFFQIFLRSPKIPSQKLKHLSAPFDFWSSQLWKNTFLWTWKHIILKHLETTSQNHIPTLNQTWLVLTNHHINGQELFLSWHFKLT